MISTNTSVIYIAYDIGAPWTPPCIFQDPPCLYQIENRPPILVYLFAQLLFPHTKILFKPAIGYTDSTSSINGTHSVMGHILRAEADITPWYMALTRKRHQQFRHVGPLLPFRLLFSYQKPQANIPSLQFFILFPSRKFIVVVIVFAGLLHVVSQGFRWKFPAVSPIHSVRSSAITGLCSNFLALFLQYL